MNEAKYSVMAACALLDQIDGLRHGWGKKVRTRKKFLQRELRVACRDLRRRGVISPKTWKKNNRKVD